MVTLIDHTAASALLEFVDNFKRTGRGIAAIVGLDQLRARSHAETSMRISAPMLAQERSAALEALARIGLTYSDPDQPDPLVLLERISLTHAGPIPGQDDHPITMALVHGWRFLGRITMVVPHSIRSIFVFSGGETFTFADHDMAWTSLERMEHEDAPSELEKLSLSSHEVPKLPAGEGPPHDPRFM